MGRNLLCKAGQPLRRLLHRGDAAGAMDTKSRLTRFFQKYNPSNVAHIDKVMAAYAGKEDQMWTALAQNYGLAMSADGAIVGFE